ncbi:MAG: CrcB family protein [bacterium]|nr:CrcB family protein [bacterium]
MVNIFAVFLGGGLGCVFRYLVALFSKFVLNSFFANPSENIVQNTVSILLKTVLATFVVNVIGSFIIGFVFGMYLKRPFSNSVKLALTTGFCGGLTTFSTFSYESYELLKNGSYILGLSYIVLSFVVCIVFAGLGVYVAEHV